MQELSQDVYDESEQYLDKVYSSLNWLPDGPWSTQEKQPKQKLRDIGFRGPIEERDATNEFLSTELICQGDAREFEFQVIRALSKSYAAFRRLRGKVNVEVITNLLEDEPFLPRDELLALVNGAYKATLISHPELNAFGTHEELPHNHSADLEEYYRLFRGIETRTCENGGAQVSFKNVIYRDDPTNDTQRAYRAFLLSWMNQSDLSNPKLLAHLIINRMNCDPSAFTFADWEALHLGRASKLFLPKFVDNRFIGILTPDDVQKGIQMGLKRNAPYFFFVDDFILICHTDQRDADQDWMFEHLRKSGRLFAWADGIHLLHTQALLYRILYGVTKAIAIKSGQPRGEVGAETVDNDRVDAWTEAHRPERIFYFENEGIVEYGLYMPPASLDRKWLDEFKTKFTRQLQWSKDHLRNLWLDPFYFQQCVDEQFQQHYGHVSEQPQTSVHHVPKNAAMAVSYQGELPHFLARDIDAKKSLINDIVRRVVQWALYEVEMWQCLVSKIDALWNLARASGVNLWCSEDSQRLEIPDDQPEVKEAWVDLGFHARWFVERRINHVVGHGGLFATETTRHLFRRDTGWPSLQVVKDDWDLPKEYAGIKIDFTIRGRESATHGDAMDIDNNDMNEPDIENLDSPTWWSIKNVHTGLTSNFSIGTIGLPKLIRALRTKLYERHAELGAQTTVTRDYEAIHLTGLLCHHMQLVHPFGQDLLDAEGRSTRRRESPVGPFLIGFDDVPFEDLVQEETLRYTQWLLGVVYKPHGDKDYGRHSLLAQLWVKSFWQELCNGLVKSTKELEWEESEESKDSKGSKVFKKSKKKTSPAGGGRGGGGIARHGSKRSKVSKNAATPRYCRPAGVQRYLAAEPPGKIDLELKRPWYDCKKICGEIMTVAPPDHREPPHWDSRLPKLVVVSTPEDKEAEKKDETDKVVISRSVWPTIQSIWNHGVAAVDKRNIFELFSAFNFARQTMEGSRERFSWTPHSAFPEPTGANGEPEAASITIHLPHDASDNMRSDQRRYAVWNLSKGKRGRNPRRCTMLQTLPIPILSHHYGGPQTTLAGRSVVTPPDRPNSLPTSLILHSSHSRITANAAPNGGGTPSPARSQIHGHEDAPLDEAHVQEEAEE
ncbi:hypothetical protein JMJ77_0008630 [Colletotrichum scovillei]|uniref:Uncharacterized protein n=1 Tax=Colletotrichum scovillei TaxID=1209932 RepID=A0A9P7RF58_9PEZI|nr:hypothetical protein JMJ77_0008630 [Colletotrichum scovillei]KAG7082735.1 hypothetical protein JMJ78_0004834 [Colletotrichum scovillei]